MKLAAAFLLGFLTAWLTLDAMIGLRVRVGE